MTALRLVLASIGVLAAALVGGLIAFTVIWIVTAETSLRASTEGFLFYVGGALGAVLGARYALPLLHKARSH